MKDFFDNLMAALDADLEYRGKFHLLDGLDSTLMTLGITRVLNARS